jgi:hypothetical protein
MSLITVAAGAGRLIGASTEVVVISAYAVMVPYLVLKRVYLEANGVILLKAGALLILIVAVNNFASLAAIRLTLELV